MANDYKHLDGRIGSVLYNFLESGPRPSSASVDRGLEKAVRHLIDKEIPRIERTTREAVVKIPTTYVTLGVREIKDVLFFYNLEGSEETYQKKIKWKKRYNPK